MDAIRSVVSQERCATDVGWAARTDHIAAMKQFEDLIRRVRTILSDALPMSDSNSRCVPRLRCAQCGPVLEQLGKRAVRRPVPRDGGESARLHDHAARGVFVQFQIDGGRLQQILDQLVVCRVDRWTAGKEASLSELTGHAHTLTDPTRPSTPTSNGPHPTGTPRCPLPGDETIVTTAPRRW